jgi:hypothetical protein
VNFWRYIPGANEVSFADEPDSTVGVGLPLHRHRLLRPWRTHLPGKKQPPQLSLVTLMISFLADIFEIALKAVYSR